MSTMGVKIDLFDVPVCNAFQAKIMNDQICYEADLNTFSDKSKVENELALGFHFLMDYNEDRQWTCNQHNTEKELDLAKSVSASNQNHHAFVYLDTIGRSNQIIINCILLYYG